MKQQEEATTTLTPEQSALLWHALITHANDPRYVHEAGEARALRDLLIGGSVTVTPYP